MFRKNQIALWLLLFYAGAGCTSNDQGNTNSDTFPIISDANQVIIDSAKVTTPLPSLPQGERFINTGDIKPDELIAYAKTLIGTPYKYGSTDPGVGFDCSGFITHIFNHFNISVPRPSVDFTDIDRPIHISDAKKGDLILFTGTDSIDREVGHMGVIVSDSSKELSFIHSSSGKANGVTITPLNEYYQGRFVKVIRIFPQNDN